MARPFYQPAPMDDVGEAPCWHEHIQLHKAETMTVNHGDSGDKAARMTCVFACGVRSLKSNPHKIDTPFGRALIIADGDLAADIDVKNDRVEALEAQVERNDAAIKHMDSQIEALEALLQSAERVVEAARTAIEKMDKGALGPWHEEWLDDTRKALAAYDKETGARNPPSDK